MSCCGILPSKFFPTILGSQTLGKWDHNSRQAVRNYVGISSDYQTKELFNFKGKKALVQSLSRYALMMIADMHNEIMDTQLNLKIKFVAIIGLACLGVLAMVAHSIEVTARLILGIITTPLLLSEKQNIPITLIAGARYNLGLIASAMIEIGLLFTQKKAITKQNIVFESFNEVVDFVKVLLHK